MAAQNAAILGAGMIAAYGCASIHKECGFKPLPAGKMQWASDWINRYGGHDPPLTLQLARTKANSDSWDVTQWCNRL
jgi:hypothetical protein